MRLSAWMRIASLLVALVGCANGLSMPGTDVDGPKTAVPLRAGDLLGVPGETVEYRVALRGFTVGNVVVAVGDVGVVDGHRAVVVRSRGAGGGAFALFSEASWDLKTVLALDLGKALSEEETIDVALPVGEKEHLHEKRDLLHDSTYNLHSAAGALRAWRSKIGDTAKFDVRIVDAHLAVELSDKAREPVGNMPAVRYDGVAKARFTYQLSIWISDDEARVPLRLTAQTRFGEVVIDMVSYEAGDVVLSP